MAPEARSTGWPGRVAIDVERALPALTVPPAADPPLFMNGVGGLGAPFWKPDFPVEFIGGGDDLQRLAAVVESIVFLLSVNLEVMRGVAALERVVISGGLARCDYLCQALADVIGLVVERYALQEATARGIAFLAAGEPADWLVPASSARSRRPKTPHSRRATRAGAARWHSAARSCSRRTRRSVGVRDVFCAPGLPAASRTRAEDRPGSRRPLRRRTRGKISSAGSDGTR